MKKIKMCAVRLEAELHLKVRMEALKSDMTLQAWITKLILEHFNKVT